MDLGIFDHLDRREGVPLDEFYESRLKLLERYDAAGFAAYHLAEHHMTPLGLAPVPGIFLAAASQRTRRIRLGPCVYCLPLYNPLRLIEEICMLDHLSRGRFDFGVGRGIVPYEMAYFDLHHLETEEIYQEALAVILQGLTSDVLDHRGPRFTFRKVPMVMKPFQQPHPPLWYGMGHMAGAEWAATNRVHVICNNPRDLARPLFTRYREVWQRKHGDAVMPRRWPGRTTRCGSRTSPSSGATSAPCRSVSRRTSTRPASVASPSRAHRRGYARRSSARSRPASAPTSSVAWCSGT